MRVNLYRFIATGCGVGLIPFAPGTFGSLLAVPPAYFLATEVRNIPALSMQVGILLCWIGIRSCGRCLQGAGVRIQGSERRRAGKDSDPSEIVIDEVLGQWITYGILFSAYPLTGPMLWAGLGFGFLAFRLFDILKPWPVSWADRKVKGALGIMLDDIIAGALAGGVVALALWQ
jgi:phosphatidylglycerophosphatase A